MMRELQCQQDQLVDRVMSHMASTVRGATNASGTDKNDYRVSPLSTSMFYRALDCYMADALTRVQRYGDCTFKVGVVYCMRAGLPGTEEYAVDVWLPKAAMRAHFDRYHQLVSFGVEGGWPKVRIYLSMPPGIKYALPNMPVLPTDVQFWNDNGAIINTDGLDMYFEVVDHKLTISHYERDGQKRDTCVSSFKMS